MTTPDKKKLGRPVDSHKTQKVFDAIDSILANQGLSGLSIEGIAKLAGISKVTLYRRFGNIKGALSAYVEVFTQHAIDNATQSYGTDDNLGTIEEQLNRLGLALLTLICQPRVIAFDNAIIAAGPELTELKERLYLQGPLKAAETIGSLLEQADIRSPLFNTPELGALLFSIWQSQVYDRARMNGSLEMSPEELARHITKGTRFFLEALRDQR
jgi:AcrR family transcriptional regulator